MLDQRLKPTVIMNCLDVTGKANSKTIRRAVRQAASTRRTRLSTGTSAVNKIKGDSINRASASGHCLLSGLRGDLLLRLTKGRNGSV